MLKIHNNPPRREWPALTARCTRQEGEITERVAAILSQVRTGGDKALRDLVARIEGYVPERFEVSRRQRTEAAKAVPQRLKTALAIAKSNIEAFHRAQLPPQVDIEVMPGVRCVQRAVAIGRVGLYVPGGNAPLFSTVLMLALPARIAGCGEVILCTPAGRGGKIAPEVLFAADLGGVDRIFAVGGAQAVAAMAYGTESIPKVDKIVGPGNQFVAEAKKQVFGQVGIDMVAGPSEILVIADGKCRPEIVAADLLSQAEHDPNASAVLVTDSAALAEAVQAAVEEQLPKLLRKDIARASIDRNGKIIVAQSLDTAVEIANEIAPEHLELCVEQPFDYLDKIQNAGSVFLGRNCPEALGDYFAGPNHTLPTSGTARFSSPLSVDDFVKKMQYTYYTKRALEKAQMSVSNFAKKEGLTGHARSVDIRFDPAFAEETP